MANLFSGAGSCHCPSSCFISIPFNTAIRVHGLPTLHLRYFMISGLPNFRSLQIRYFMTLGLANFKAFTTSLLQDFTTSGLRDFRISRYHDMMTSRYHGFMTSRHQSLTNSQCFSGFIFMIINTPYTTRDSQPIFFFLVGRRALIHDFHIISKSEPSLFSRDFYECSLELWIRVT